ncbi:hypothetical protein EMIT0P395_30131 [Pseudomonas sp. IT-P395]
MAGLSQHTVGGFTWRSTCDRPSSNRARHCITRIAIILELLSLSSSTFILNCTQWVAGNEPPNFVSIGVYPQTNLVGGWHWLSVLHPHASPFPSFLVSCSGKSRVPARLGKWNERPVRVIFITGV